MAPTKKFKTSELDALKQYLEGGKSIIFMAGEGGELKLGTNINYLLENNGIFINDDAVIRTSYFKYFNPKEVFIQNGVCDQEFIRVANKKEKQTVGKQNRRLAFALDNEYDDDNPDSGLGGFHFVYPFGCTLTVNHPAVPLLTSGPISYPVNKPLMAMFRNKKRGKLVVIGSYEMLSDDYIEKEENEKIAIFISALLEDKEFEPDMKDKGKGKKGEEQIDDIIKIPDIAEMSENLKACLQVDFSDSFENNYFCDFYFNNFV